MYDSILRLLMLTVKNSFFSVMASRQLKNESYLLIKTYKSSDTSPSYDKGEK